MTVCICKEVKCPYFNEHINGFGCQRYNVASVCHLVREFGIKNVTQYAIYDQDSQNIELYKDSNIKFFQKDEKYKDDLDFVMANSDWIEGWKVQPLS